MLININEERVSKIKETGEISGIEKRDILQEESAILKARRKGREEGRAEALEIIQEIKKEKMKLKDALIFEKIKARIAFDQGKAKIINIAKNMLAEGLALEQVLRISGVSIKELWASDHCKCGPRYSPTTIPSDTQEHMKDLVQSL